MWMSNVLSLRVLCSLRGIKVEQRTLNDNASSLVDMAKVSIDRNRFVLAVWQPESLKSVQRVSFQRLISCLKQCFWEVESVWDSLIKKVFWHSGGWRFTNRIIIIIIITPTWHLTLLFNLLPLRILVPSAGQRWSSSVTSVASWAVFPVRSELRHFSSNVFRCRFSVFILFCFTTPSWLTTSRTNSHSSFDFNFLLLTLGNYTPRGLK